MAEIEKAYLQIGVATEHLAFLRSMWFNDH